MASKEQLEGVARVFDALAVSSIVAASVGATGHGVMTSVEIISLVVLSPILMVTAWILRRPKK